jgi:mannosyl-oligosaccharide alpha-1,2-mannosidase
MNPHDIHSEKYRDRWVQAVESTRKHLIFQTEPYDLENGFEPLYFLHGYSVQGLRNEMGHLDCFAGGNMMLGGRYIGRPDITKLGAELTRTCRAIYDATLTKIGPETIRFVGIGSRNYTFTPTAKQLSAVRKKGYWVTNGQYLLRPETVESYFYGFRITGDAMYQDWAWEAYNAIVIATKSQFGYAAVYDVNIPAGKGNRLDQQESFWAAETLKYLYMIFEDEDVGNLDKWVFNTEAHPFKILKKPSLSYSPLKSQLEAESESVLKE